MSSDMLREVSESLFEFLIEAFPTDRSYTRPDFEQDPMPPLIAHFLGQVLQNKLDAEIEHLRAVRSTWFDYDHPDVQQTYSTFISALSLRGHVPSEEWRGTLKRATKFVTAHLVLPSHTLVEYVFRDDEGPLSAEVIYRHLNYFAAYPYLREAVETFLQKRQLQEIDRTRFSSLLVQIDRHMTAHYSSDDWLRLLRPLYDLMRRVPITRNQGIPIDLLSTFFGDKDAYEIQGRLQVEKEVHRTVAIDEDGLRRVIEGSVGPFEQRLESTRPATPSEPQPAPKVEHHMEFGPAPSHKRAAVEEKSKEPAPSADNEPQQPRPLWEQFQKPTSSAKETDAAAGNGTPKSEKAPQTDKSVPLWMQFQKNKDVGTAEQPGPALRGSAASLQDLALDAGKGDQPPTPGHPVARASSPPKAGTSSLVQLERKVLGIYGSSNRHMFVEQLFGGSTQAYELLLRQLSNSTNWIEASKIIADEVFKKNHVDIYGQAAIVFTESVEDQFR